MPAMAILLMMFFLLVEQPAAEAVQEEDETERLWRTNPNLVPNPNFEKPGQWQAILRAEKYPVRMSDTLPAGDRAGIYRLPGEGEYEPRHVLAMRVSQPTAHGPGLACLSDPIPIEPGTRYRLGFRYRSDGPVVRVFVKGYTMFEEADGRRVEREVYRRQVPQRGATHGEWVTVLDDLNPRHGRFPINHLRVDLFVHLHEGMIQFDEVVLKAVSRPAGEVGVGLPLDAEEVADDQEDKD